MIFISSWCMGFSLILKLFTLSEARDCGGGGDRVFFSTTALLFSRAGFPGQGGRELELGRDL